jgi:hypothetical protein
MGEQENDRWKTLSQDLDRLRDADQQNVEIKIKLARSEARCRKLEAELAAAQSLIRSLQGEPTLAAAPPVRAKPNGKSNGKAHR